RGRQWTSAATMNHGADASEPGPAHRSPWTARGDMLAIGDWHSEEDTDEAGNGGHVVGAAGEARSGDAAPLRRWRLSARHSRPRLSQRSPRPYRHVRLYGPGARQGDARGRDLSPLFDEQAGHRSGADAAPRRGPDRPGRRRPQPYPRLEEPRRLRQRRAVAA